MIKATIDREAEMSYINLAKRNYGGTITTIERDGFNIDIDESGTILGIEIFGILELEDIA